MNKKGVLSVNIEKEMTKQVYTYRVREYKHPSRSMLKMNPLKLFQEELFSIKIKGVWIDYVPKHDVFVVNGSDDVDEYVGRKNKKLMQLLKKVADFEVEAESDGLCRYLNFKVTEDGVQCRLAKKPWLDTSYIKLKEFMKRSADEDRQCVVCLEIVGGVGVVDTFMCCGTVLHSVCCSQLVEDRCPICRTWCYR